MTDDLWPIPLMIESPLEQALWVGALAALANREPAHLEGDLSHLAELLLRSVRPRAQA